MKVVSFGEMTEKLFYLLERGYHGKLYSNIYKIGFTNDLNSRINEYPLDNQIVSA
jgi:hypothetical protein